MRPVAPNQEINFKLPSVGAKKKKSRNDTRLTLTSLLLFLFGGEGKGLHTKEEEVKEDVSGMETSEDGRSASFLVFLHEAALPPQ